MSSSIFHASPILLIILFHSLLSTESTFSVRIPETGLRVTLTRAHSRNTFPNTLSNAGSESKIPTLDISFPMKAAYDIYNIRLAIGTPPVEFKAIMDTGSDLIWTKCQQNFPKFFNPNKSSSFSKVAKNRCESFQLPGCKQNYEDHTSVSVDLGLETLTFGNEKISDVIFACGTPSKNSYLDGVVGMGHGELSLISQLKVRVFAYCLGSRVPPSETGVLLIGDKARNAFDKSSFQTTKLITMNNSPYYYLSLEGISLGETRLPVTKSDFAVDGRGDGGMIIDSGTTFMYLEQRIADIISDAFLNQTNLSKFEVIGDQNPYKNDLKYCFKIGISYEKIPNLVFHFEGANWEIKKENYIYRMKGDAACLAIIGNPKNEKVSVFGNMQQQNMMVVYDLDNGSLSFKPANCNEF